MKPISEYFFYKLFTQYNEVCHRIDNIKDDSEFLAIVSELKANLATSFKQHKVRVSSAEWNYFDLYLKFSDKFWAKLRENLPALAEYKKHFEATTTKIDTLQQNLYTQKNSLRLDMWAHTNSIPVELFIANEIAPLTHWFVQRYGGHIEIGEEEAIEWAKHLFNIGFKTGIKRFIPDKSSPVARFSYMVFANVKPELSDLLLACWSIDTINESLPLIYPVKKYDDTTELAQHPNAVWFDDYSLDSDR